MDKNKEELRMKTAEELMIERQQKALIPKLSHNSRVEVIKGFYKGYTGIVTSYAVKDGIIHYYTEIIEMENSPQWFKEDEIRVKKKFLGIF